MMNCDTGQITNDPELIRKWREAGVPVLDLPDDATVGRETYSTPTLVDPSEEARNSPERRLARALHTARLNKLCGKR